LAQPSISMKAMALLLRTLERRVIEIKICET
jgi:hypothetical protein